MQFRNDQNNYLQTSGGSQCLRIQDGCEKKKDSRPFLATSHNKSISQGGVHGKYRPIVSSSHDSTQHVIFPHTDISTDGTCKRQVILKRSEEGGDKLIKGSNRVQTCNSLRQCEPISPWIESMDGGRHDSRVRKPEREDQLCEGLVLPGLLLISWNNLL